MIPLIHTIIIQENPKQLHIKIWYIKIMKLWRHTFDAQHFDRQRGSAETKFVLGLNPEAIVLVISEVGDVVEGMWYPAYQWSPRGARWLLDVDGVGDRAAVRQVQGEVGWSPGQPEWARWTNVVHQRLLLWQGRSNLKNKKKCLINFVQLIQFETSKYN